MEMVHLYYFNVDGGHKARMIAYDFLKYLRLRSEVRVCCTTFYVVLGTADDHIKHLLNDIFVDGQ